MFDSKIMIIFWWNMKKFVDFVEKKYESWFWLNKTAD